jgi:hypothetical protein
MRKYNLSSLVQFLALGAALTGLIGLPAWAGDSNEGSEGESGSSAEDDQANFNKELLSIEQQVDDIKERVFRSKATLQLLQEIVVQGAASGAKATIWHINRLGSAYELRAITYLLDGQTKFSKSDNSGALSDSKEFKIHDGAIPPGNHNLSVDFQIQPTGFGLFTYAKTYEVYVRATYAFAVEIGKQCTIRTTLSDRGGLENSFEERAKASFDIKCERITE